MKRMRRDVQQLLDAMAFIILEDDQIALEKAVEEEGRKTTKPEKNIPFKATGSPSVDIPNGIVTPHNGDSDL